MVESTSVSIKITFPPVYPLAPGSCAVTVELYLRELRLKKDTNGVNRFCAHLSLFGHKINSLGGRRNSCILSQDRSVICRFLFWRLVSWSVNTKMRYFIETILFNSPHSVCDSCVLPVLNSSERKKKITINFQFPKHSNIVHFERLKSAKCCSKVVVILECL